MMSQYPTIKFIVERGDILAIVIAVLPLCGAVALVVLFAWHWLALVAGIAGSLVLLLLMRSYVELVRVIADMLLPK